MFKPKPERTGWRDQRISERHRSWGIGSPAFDLDLILVEYSHCEPKALIEYKHERAAPVYLSDANYKALIRLADRAEIPAFIVRYANDFSWLNVCPLNALAKKWLPQKSKVTEDEYVRFLYRLRGIKPPLRFLGPNRQKIARNAKM